jgi:hypothetical protein
VITAHKILIGTAIAFFFGYGLWELAHYGRGGGGGALFRCVASELASAGLGVYLWAFLRWVRRRGEDGR